MSDTKFDLSVVIEQAKQVITKPIQFYRDMPTSGGFADPLIFVVVAAFITGFIVSLFGLLGLSFNALMGGAASVSMIVVFPILALIGSFIGAGILFVVWKLMGSEQNYECAYRCVAYSFAIAPVIAIASIIPYIAGIVKTLWSCFLLYTASTEVHKLKSETSKWVFGILAAIGVLVGISSEKAARSFQSFSERFTEQTSEGALETLENLENMSPEEAGKELGKFLKGLEEFQKGMEKELDEAK